MARKSKTDLPQSAGLTPQQMRQGIERIRMRIADLEKFEPEKVNRRWAPETKALETAIAETLSRVFGHGTVEYRRYGDAASLDRGPLILNHEDTPREVHQYLRDGIARSKALLEQAVRGLQEELGMAAPTEATAGPLESPAAADAPVFVAHGRDSPAKIEVARLVERAGLHAVILHEQPNEGRTIIEKFEHHGGDAGFAVVVLTPDDVGGPTDLQLQPRARQNVIGEMFWFAGRLGRKRGVLS